MSPRSTPEKSSAGGSGRGAANGHEEKPRLTEEQKRQNHISSEQKRRTAIRDGFDRLAAIVPGLEGQGRSEGHVLNVTTQFLVEKIRERQRLVYEVEARGGTVPEELKEAARIDVTKMNLDHIPGAKPPRNWSPNEDEEEAREQSQSVPGPSESQERP